MKKLFFAIALILPAIAFCQETIEIKESEAPMTHGVKPDYEVLIPQAKSKDVANSFKKYIKQGSKAKVVENGGEISILGAVNSNVSALPFNVFGKMVETVNGVLATIWLSEGEVFMSSSNLSAAKAEAAKKYVRDFAIQEYKSVVQNELKLEQDKAKDAQKVLDGYIKDQKKAESAIMDHKAEIANREKKIKEEEQNIANAIANQEKQKSLTDAQAGVATSVQQKLGNIK